MDSHMQSYKDACKAMNSLASDGVFLLTDKYKKTWPGDEAIARIVKEVVERERKWDERERMWAEGERKRKRAQEREQESKKKTKTSRRQ